MNRSADRRPKVICQHLRRGPSCAQTRSSGKRPPQVSPDADESTSAPQPSSVTLLHDASANQPLRGSLRSSRWERLSHGLYVPREPRRLTVDLAAWQLVLPASACFTSLTSAQLRGWWQPSAVTHPVFVSVPSHDPHPQRRGLHVSRHPRPVPSEIIDGIHVASAAETLLAAARDLTLLELVVLGDAALHVGDCTIDQLSSTASQRRRGAPLLRAAIPLLDKRSESPWESVLRLLHVVADIEVEPQKKIYDEWGNFVARADLWVVGTRRIHEYDGEKHRERDTHRADLTRERRLVEVNVQRVGFTSPQLLHEGASIIAGLDRLLGRTWNPRRLARWEALLDHSLLRPSGRAEAMRRWRRSM